MKIKTGALFISAEVTWREIGFTSFPECGDKAHWSLLKFHHRFLCATVKGRFHIIKCIGIKSNNVLSFLILLSYNFKSGLSCNVIFLYICLYCVSFSFRNLYKI
jgi:hypothetical protein